MQLEAHRPILGAQQFPHKGGGTGVTAKVSLRFPFFRRGLRLLNQPNITVNQRGQAPARLAADRLVRPIQELPNTPLPFPVLGGIAFEQGIEPGTPMGIDGKIGLLLLSQILKTKNKNHMF
jgi:hypothetical protein